MSLYIFNQFFVQKSYDYPDLGINDPLIIDIGANKGLFTICVKELYSNLKCYEPSPSNFEQRSHNIKLRGLKDIELVNKGDGGSSRTEKLY